METNLEIDRDLAVDRISVDVMGTEKDLNNFFDEYLPLIDELIKKHNLCKEE